MEFSPVYYVKPCAGQNFEGPGIKKHTIRHNISPGSHFHFLVTPAFPYFAFFIELPCGSNVRRFGTD